jgi:hypothetical protein
MPRVEREARPREIATPGKGVFPISFNPFILSRSNVAAIRLWQKLRFEIQALCPAHFGILKKET